MRAFSSAMCRSEDAPAAARDPSIEKYSRSCRAWAGTATENPAPLNAARRRMIRIDGLSLGNGTAFSAVAPSQPKIFGSGIPIMSPRARIPGRLTSCRLVSSPPRPEEVGHEHPPEPGPELVQEGPLPRRLIEVAHRDRRGENPDVPLAAVQHGPRRLRPD